MTCEGEKNKGCCYLDEMTKKKRGIRSNIWGFSVCAADMTLLRSNVYNRQSSTHTHYMYSSQSINITQGRI